jgi:MFS family permease
MKTEIAASPASISAAASTAGPWWKELTPYHWFVFAMASMAWMFDCFGQQVFILGRNLAITALSPGLDPAQIKEAGGISTAIFVAGWAMGGLIFGSVGDRIGRARTLTITVLLYSVFTGVSAFVTTVPMFNLLRFITGLGVGGVFGLAVALVADSLPNRARPHALGLLQALSAIGNVAAGLTQMLFSKMEGSGIPRGSSWKYMFFVGAVPALLCVVTAMRLKEPEKWVQARAAGKATGVKFGSYASLFGEPLWRKHALLGMMLCIAGVVGLWGVGFFSPELVGPVIERSLRAAGGDPARIASDKTFWIGLNSIVQNIGAFFGMLAFAKAAQRFGRKKPFAVGFIAAFIATVGFFQFFNGKSDIWMSAVMGGCQLALFSGFAIFLPELFPLRLRSTGTSFCYNVGRFIAASGPLTLGKLQAVLAANAHTAEAKLGAFRNAASYLSVILLVGLIAVFFLPETKGKPLPEDT